MLFWKMLIWKNTGQWTLWVWPSLKMERCRRRRCGAPRPASEVNNWSAGGAASAFILLCTSKSRERRIVFERNQRRRLAQASGYRRVGSDRNPSAAFRAVGRTVTPSASVPR